MDYMLPFRSELKLKVLLSLLKGDRKIADLRTDIGIRDTSILHVLEEFMELKLITKAQGSYRLSSIGIMEAKICKEYYSTIEVLEKFNAFWLLHKTDAIPTRLMLNIGALKNAELVCTEASELGIVHDNFVSIVLASKMLKGISPIFHPDFILYFGQLLNQGNTIELIINSAVFKKIVDSADYDLLKKYLKSNSLKLFLKEDLTMALSITDISFSFGLFSLSGKYDDSMDLISANREAIEWGEQLFEEALKSSERIGIDKLP